ncbi:signal peptide peptidase-domain-containing protein [Lactifluus volemus]|nr:signal peptide peptidase-domain-containing protein [Lactifluus volemus]
MSNGLNVDLLSAYVGIITTATISIYFGSFGSLSKSKDPSDNDEEDSMPRLTSEEAWLFPVIGSVLLGGLFLVIKYFGKEWINWLLSLYFILAGFYSVPHSLIRLAKIMYGTQRWNEFDRHRVRFEKATNNVASFSVRTPSLFLTPIGVIPSLLYAFGNGPSKSILLTNILALSLACEAMSMLKIDSFRTGSILLSGLFVYDVWWVFGTKVMVSVATSLDLPMKILWPKSITFSAENGNMMLGLGDIVVPGLFISLALRYDHFRHTRTRAAAAGPFSKPYFIASLAAYIAGLATTMVVMHIFRAAQPALLYLSPACILSFVLTAWRRGELIESWKWNDGDGDVAAPSKDGSTVDKMGSDAGGAAAGVSSELGRPLTPPEADYW